MRANVAARLAIPLLFCGTILGCGSIWRVSSFEVDNRDRVVPAASSSASQYLDDRAAIDENARILFQTQGRPDYVTVRAVSFASNTPRLIYVGDDRVIALEGPSTGSHTVVEGPIPDDLLALLTPADRSRIATSRGSASADHPTLSPVPIPATESPTRRVDETSTPTQPVINTSTPTPVTASVTPTGAPNVQVHDDPFNDFVEFDFASLRLDDAKYSIVAMKDRASGTAKYEIIFAQIYSGSEWQDYGAASLLGGTNLETHSVNRRVLSCGDYGTCTYAEIVTITLPRSALNGAVSVKLFGNTQRHVLAFDEAYVHGVLSAVEGQR